nr:histidine kinase [Saprospiraceae bacterium]
IYEDTQKAEQYVLKMAMVYRHMLDESGETLTLLSQELKYIGAYQFLLKERFGDAIQFVEDIPQEVRSRFVVPLGLQIVLENCVKHNAATAEQPLTIHMYISKQGDCLCVDNNILPKPAIIDSPGLGLKNIQRRYAFFTTQPVTIHEDGVKFTVCLPLLVSKEIVK